MEVLRLSLGSRDGDLRQTTLHPARTKTPDVPSCSVAWNLMCETHHVTVFEVLTAVNVCTELFCYVMSSCGHHRFGGTWCLFKKTAEIFCWLLLTTYHTTCWLLLTTYHTTCWLLLTTHHRTLCQYPEWLELSCSVTFVCIVSCFWSSKFMFRYIKKENKIHTPQSSRRH